MKKRAPTGPRDDGFIRRIEIDPREEVDRTRFPLSLKAFQSFERLELHPRCTFIIGENGTGKSTLLEAIAVLAKFPAEGGSTKHQVKTHDTHSDLWQVLRLARGPDLQDDDFFLRAESFYNVGTYLHETMGTGSRYGRKGSVHLTSHGESFLDVFVEWKPHGLYLLDEPESALSPSRQLAFYQGGLLDRLFEGIKHVEGRHDIESVAGKGDGRHGRAGEPGPSGLAADGEAGRGQIEPERPAELAQELEVGAGAATAVQKPRVREALGCLPQQRGDEQSKAPKPEMAGFGTRRGAQQMLHGRHCSVSRTCPSTSDRLTSCS